MVGIGPVVVVGGGVVAISFLEFDFKIKKNNDTSSIFKIEINGKILVTITLSFFKGMWTSQKYMWTIFLDHYFYI